MISRKGFVMITLMVLIIVLMIIGLGLSVYTIHLNRESELEVRNIKGYYLTLAALRYANLLAQDPTTYLAITPHTLTGFELGGNLGRDLSTTVTTTHTQAVDSIYTTIDSNAGAYAASSEYTYY